LKIRGQIMIGCVAGVYDVGVGHIQIVKVQDEETPRREARMCRRARRWLARHGKRRRGWSLRRRNLSLKLSDGLLFAPIEEMEILFLEAFDRLALRVAHYHADHHQVAGYF
jgi:hypothetical protein